MDLLHISKSLDKIGSGLEKYNYIMDRLYKTNTFEDKEFQRKFNAFYRIRQRSPEFYNCYYGLLEDSKAKKVSFEEVIRYIHERLGRIEPSFSSKLVATIDPEKPVWDSFVLKNLGLKPPYYSDKDRLNKNILLYDRICDWYENYLQTDEAKKAIELFNKRYPDISITNVKKIDLILWQTR